MTTQRRVVLDTNVVLSALLFTQGRLAPLRPAWQARFQPLASATTIGELIRALAYPKFELSHDEQQELLGDYLPYCIAVRMPARAPKTPACKDPADIAFLQLAIVGKAEYLVTGDKQLLGLTGQLSCPIITAQQFLGTLA